MSLGLGATRIVTSADGTYTPESDGDYAAIVPVHDVNHELVDLLAWHVGSPGRWWRRFAAWPVLGARDLAKARYYHDPVVLHSTPDAWVLAGGEGVCLLDWHLDLRPLFQGVSAVRCDSQTLAARFQTAMRRWEPKTTISRVKTRHAA